MTISTVWMILAATFGRRSAAHPDAIVYDAHTAAEWLDMIESATMRAGKVSA